MSFPIKIKPCANTGNPIRDNCVANTFPGNPPSPFGDPGTCIPTKLSAQACSTNITGCACLIFPEKDQDCRYQLSIIDVYIVNKTDQRLHLSDTTKISTTTSEPSNQPPSSEWIPVPGPPNVIEIGDTQLIRGVVSCIGSCCRLCVEFAVDIAYTIGVAKKKLGTISTTISRTKPADGRGCSTRCFDLTVKDTAFLRQGFGKLCETKPASINPLTQVYRVTGNITRSTQSQYVMRVFGGNVVNGGIGCTGAGRGSCEVDQLCVNEICMKGCTGNSGCPSGQVCSNDVCVSSTDKLPTKKLLIIITVSVTVFILVIGFLYFLITVGKSSKKTS